jgi:hypothetical protein
MRQPHQETTYEYLGSMCQAPQSPLRPPVRLVVAPINGLQTVTLFVLLGELGVQVAFMSDREDLCVTRMLMLPLWTYGLSVNSACLEQRVKCGCCCCCVAWFRGSRISCMPVVSNHSLGGAQQAYTYTLAARVVVCSNKRRQGSPAGALLAHLSKLHVLMAVCVS